MEKEKFQVIIFIVIGIYPNLCFFLRAMALKYVDAVIAESTERR